MRMAMVLNFAGWAILIAANLYVLLAALAQTIWFLRPVSRTSLDALPAVSILKPLCGDEPRLYQNLRSFCLQAYPQFQLIFGTRFADDPALTVARQLQTEFPQLDISVVCAPQIHGRNLKISNLINMLPAARHDVLVISDSDIKVDPDYLGNVIAPLQRAEVGLVTCLYHGRAIGGFWTHLGKLFIDDWFRPSVLLTRLFGASTFGFGATLALRRDTLNAIGGLQKLASSLADDQALGAIVRAHGLRTVLSRQEVATDVTERRLEELAAHELRWLRTIRMVQPLGYSFSFVTFTMPVAFGSWLLIRNQAMATPLLLLALSGRLMLHFQSIRRSRNTSPLTSLISRTIFDLGLLAARDTLSLGLWALAFFGTRVSWRGQQLFAVAGNNIPLTEAESSEISS